MATQPSLMVHGNLMSACCECIRICTREIVDVAYVFYVRVEFDIREFEIRELI